MRLFYAIEFDEETRNILLREQGKIKSRAIKANFTRRENLHLTLRFMGEIESMYLPVLRKIQDYVTGRSVPFKLILSGPGVFVRGHKSIVWWGIRNEDHLIDMQKNMEEEIRRNGFPKEVKPYTPHITLARELVSNENIKDVIKGLQPLNHTVEVKGISLMESTRVNGVLTYISRYCTWL